MRALHVAVSWVHLLESRLGGTAATSVASRPPRRSRRDCPSSSVTPGGQNGAHLTARAVRVSMKSGAFAAELGRHLVPRCAMPGGRSRVRVVSRAIVHRRLIARGPANALPIDFQEE